MADTSPGDGWRSAVKEVCMRRCDPDCADGTSRPTAEAAEARGWVRSRRRPLDLIRGSSVGVPILLSLAVVVTTPSAVASAQQEAGEVERLERQLRACERALERRGGADELEERRRRLGDAKAGYDAAYLERTRLRDEVEDLRQAEAEANAALDNWSSANGGERLDEATARVTGAVLARVSKEEELRRAEERVRLARDAEDDAELELSLLQTHLAVAGSDAESVREQCEQLRARLRAAGAAGAAAGAAPTPTATGGWGLEEGRSWTEEAPEATPAPDDWWGETGGSSGGGGHSTPTPPGTGPRRTPATPTPAPTGPPRPPNRTTLDAGAGPYHEFAALCRLGWASTLAEYSIGPADASIADHLRMAGEHIRAANLTTFDPLRAWPDWAARQRHYNALAERIPGADATRRRQLALEIDTGWSGLVDDLAWQLAGELQHRENCDSHYARLGYRLCSGQQSLQIAEVAEREGDRELAQRTAREGRDHLVAARRELEALPTVRLATGRCIDLGTVLRELSSSPRRDLHDEVEAANAAFAQAVRLLAAATAQPQLAVAFGNVAASGWTWGANLNADVLFTPPEPFTVTGVRRCIADWSPNPTPCQAESRLRSVDGGPRTFCCAGFWLTGTINVPGRGTVKIQWPDTGQNRLPIPAGATVNLGGLYMLAATQGDFDNDAAFALIVGFDASGRPAAVEGPVLMARDVFSSYQEMCRTVGSAMSP
jgi:hypothetical protein